MSQDVSGSSEVSLSTVARLYELTTKLHLFIYFCPEAPEEFAKVGLEGWSGYFASRTAAMGALPTEMVIATFYNFSPKRVGRAMAGVWETVTPKQAQQARWTAVARVLDTHVAPEISTEEIAETLELLQQVVDGLSWSGRPLAAGNYAVLDDCPQNDLVRIWQLVTILREWRGDAHIALLITEPLSGVECTVVTNAQYGGGFIKRARSWPDEQWDATVASMVGRGLLASEVALTDKGVSWRDDIERRTNELAAPIWANHDDMTVNRLGDLLQKMVEALPKYPAVG